MQERRLGEPGAGGHTLRLPEQAGPSGPHTSFALDPAPRRVVGDSREGPALLPGRYRPPLSHLCHHRHAPTVAELTGSWRLTEPRGSVCPVNPSAG